MKTFNAELMKTIVELKALPKKDRKAIERQLSGLDKIAVKKAFKIKPLHPPENHDEDKIDVEIDKDDTNTPNLTNFSPWLKKKLSVLLDEEGTNLKSVGVTQAVANILPDCIERANNSLEGLTVDTEISEKNSFKTMLLKLKGGEA